MDEAQNLADRVAVIAGGSIVAEGPPSTLAGRDTAATRIRFRVPASVAPAELPVEATPGPEGELEVLTEDPTGTLHRLTGWALGRGLALEGLEVSRPSLEDVYLAITGSEAGTEDENAATRGRRRGRRGR
jgi:ABC-2 type transport system ATP-binding protein